MHAKFEKYQANPNIVLLIVVMLDPSSKANIIRFYFHTVGDNVKAKMKEMRQYLGNYYLEYEKGHKETQFALVYIPFDEHTLSEATRDSGLSSSGKSQI